MNQEVQKFIDILKTDESLQRKMKSASEKFMAEQELAAFQNVVLPIAEEAGYHFTWEEYQEYVKREVKELDPEEMGQVAGGLCIWSGGLGPIQWCSRFGTDYD